MDYFDGFDNSYEFDDIDNFKIPMSINTVTWRYYYSSHNIV